MTNIFILLLLLYIFTNLGNYIYYSIPLLILYSLIKKTNNNDNDNDNNDNKSNNKSNNSKMIQLFNYSIN